MPLFYNDPDDVFSKPDEETPLGIPLYRFAERYQALLERSFKPVWTLSWNAIKVLSFLLHKEPVSQQEISNGCALNKALVVLAIDELEKMNKIVERMPDTNDRRVNLIALTEHGRNMAREFIAGAKSTERKVILSALTNQEKRQFAKLLYKALSADLVKQFEQVTDDLS